MAGGGVDCANTFFRQLILYEQRGLDVEATINHGDIEESL